MLPKRECDLIMRGGIASGIVYPTAAEALARRYRFRNIGGTSAGAIAAAATAAAEYGRREGTNPNAFADLGRIPEHLASHPTHAWSKTPLEQMLRPQAGTVPLMRLLLAVLRGGSRRTSFEQFLSLIDAVLKGFPIAAFVGAFPVLAYTLALIFVTPRSQFAQHASWVPFVGVLPSPRLVAILAMGLACALIVSLLVARRTLTFIATNCALIAIPVAAYLVSLATGMQASDDVHETIERSCGIFLWTLAMTYLAGAGATVTSVYAAYRRARRQIPRNMYGLCAGYTKGAEQARPPGMTPELTVWMHELIQRLAGRPNDRNPLTVGDLRRPGNGLDEASAGIGIALMTSNISRGMSHCFPQLEGAKGWRGELYFRRQDMECLFPPVIVDWLVATARGAMVEPMVGPMVEVKDRADARGPFLRLPLPDDLPIVLGARISMSFPFLLSAVPLYTPVHLEGGKVRMRRCWFSDGGLTSNFPIHFFDAPVPSRPTFGISLSYGDFEIEGGKAAAEMESADPDWRRYGRQILMAHSRPDDRLEFLRLNDIEQTKFKLSSFYLALFDTSRNWSDNELMSMPGFRDRIVHVRLAEHEGGYNLVMAPETIREIAAKGRLAGELLATRFDPDATSDPKTGADIALDWDHHRWQRYRDFVAAVDDMARAFAERWQDDASELGEGVRTLPAMLAQSEALPPDDQLGWRDRRQLEHGRATTRWLVDGPHVRTGEHGTLAPAATTRPHLRLRIMPPDDTAPGDVVGKAPAGGA